jgi:hypothetical protein
MFKFGGKGYLSWRKALYFLPIKDEFCRLGSALAHAQSVERIQQLAKLVCLCVCKNISYIDIKN